MIIKLKRYLLDRMKTEKRYIFSQIDEMNISTVNAKMYMKIENYIKYPLQAIELKISTIFAKNPLLINSPYRYHIHPLIQKSSDINY